LRLQGRVLRRATLPRRVPLGAWLAGPCLVATVLTGAALLAPRGLGDASAAEGSPTAPSPPSAPRFAPGGPDAEDYGASQGYPIGDRATFFRTPFLVGSSSHLDQIFEGRVMHRATTPSPLARAAAEPAVRYAYQGHTFTLEDYLSGGGAWAVSPRRARWGLPEGARRAEGLGCPWPGGVTAGPGTPRGGAAAARAQVPSRGRAPRCTAAVTVPGPTRTRRAHAGPGPPGSPPVVRLEAVCAPGGTPVTLRRAGWRGAGAPGKPRSRLPLAPVRGALAQRQSLPAAPRRTPAAPAAGPGGGIALTRDGVCEAHSVGLRSFAGVAQSLGN
jgi:hypothetical protein